MKNIKSPEKKLLPTLVLLKLANTCNLNCSYCYWFRDKSVYDKTKLIRQDVLDAFYLRLRDYIYFGGIKKFVVVLHGGEPLLAGKKKVRSVLEKLLEIECQLDMRIEVQIQTNAVLLDQEWIDMLEYFNVSVGVSMDGPKSVHDEFRKDLGGRPTYDRIISNIELLKKSKTHFGILAVYNENYSATELCSLLIDQLGIKRFDVLKPEVNHESGHIPFIQNFYIDLFKIWNEEYRDQGVKIRVAENMMNALLGKNTMMESVGNKPVGIFMIKPDGEIEASDFLHELGYQFSASRLNILDNDIAEICNDPLWNEIYNSSISLNEKCLSCKYKRVCGGGRIGTRWSKEKRFDNPSVYCDQLYAISDYISGYLTGWPAEELSSIAFQR